MSTERPILVSGPLIGPILRGEKTVTRRLAPIQFDTSQKWGPYDCWTFYKGKRPFIGFSESNRGQDLCIPHCPHGRVGDTLWVRETWAPTNPAHPKTRVSFAADMTSWARTSEGEWMFPERLDGSKLPRPDRWRPSIHMPRWAARIFLRVESVTVERLQEITEEDAKREGISEHPVCEQAMIFGVDYREAFRMVWDSLATAGSKWADNPWVWRIAFSRVTP